MKEDTVQACSTLFYSCWPWGSFYLCLRASGFGGNSDAAKGRVPRSVDKRERFLQISATGSFVWAFILFPIMKPFLEFSKLLHDGIYKNFLKSQNINTAHKFK